MLVLSTFGVATVLAGVALGSLAVAIWHRHDGPGIPDIEVQMLREGTEESLWHGRGIGLWIVTWCVQSVGGTVRFDTGGDGTTVSVEL